MVSFWAVCCKGSQVAGPKYVTNKKMFCVMVLHGGCGMFQAKISGKWWVLQRLCSLWENISEYRWTCLEVDWIQHGTGPDLVMQYSYPSSEKES
jgi:hypothetical protein